VNSSRHEPLSKLQMQLIKLLLAPRASNLCKTHTSPFAHAGMYASATHHACHTNDDAAVRTKACQAGEGLPGDPSTSRLIKCYLVSLCRPSKALQPCLVSPLLGTVLLRLARLKSCLESQ
jgi:hypothetical protein